MLGSAGFTWERFALTVAAHAFEPVGTDLERGQRRVRMPRILLSLFLVLTALTAACGLSERDRTVSTVNEGIRAVDAISHVIAELIAELPADRDLTVDDFTELRTGLSQYMDAMDELNAAMRQLGAHFEPLAAHVEDVFRPSAEAAASSCQQAHDALSDADAGQEDYQRAITRVGQCLERYAAAVSNVKAAHDRAVD